MSINKIVINGCNGSCCKQFTMHYTIDDLKLMLKALDEGKSTFIGREGMSFNCHKNSHKDLPKLINMLIPLGKTYINPNGGENINDENINNEWIEALKKRGIYEKMLDENGKLYFLIYTCKHFDKENQICTIYNDRPNMCRNFGEGCKYKGCNFDNLKKLEQEKIESLIKNKENE